jgi:hypothetical protein
MTTCNPIVYLNHAWEATNTVWGKLCIVFFYAFLWFYIISSAVNVVAPKFGAECFYEHISEFCAYTIARLSQGLNLFGIGFLLYADRGGIKVWNVATVFIFFVVWGGFFHVLVQDYPGLDGYPEECSLDGTETSNWGMIAWISLSLLFSVMETMLGPVISSGQETTPLVS